VNILPVTTLRTIDLEGKKKFQPFVFYILRKKRVFFYEYSAPEYVQINAWSSP